MISPPPSLSRGQSVHATYPAGINIFKMTLKRRLLVTSFALCITRLSIICCVKAQPWDSNRPNSTRGTSNSTNPMSFDDNLDSYYYFYYIAPSAAPIKQQSNEPSTNETDSKEPAPTQQSEELSANSTEIEKSFAPTATTTKNQSQEPSANETVSQIVGAQCCSSDYKYCLMNSAQCNTDQSCKEMCGGVLIDSSLQRTACFPLNGDCSENRINCCGNLTCKPNHQNQTFQCLPGSTYPSLQPSTFTNSTEAVPTPATTTVNFTNSTEAVLAPTTTTVNYTSSTEAVPTPTMRPTTIYFTNSTEAVLPTTTIRPTTINFTNSTEAAPSLRPTIKPTPPMSTNPKPTAQPTIKPTDPVYVATAAPTANQTNTASTMRPTTIYFTNSTEAVLPTTTIRPTTINFTNSTEAAPSLRPTIKPTPPMSTNPKPTAQPTIKPTDQVYVATAAPTANQTNELNFQVDGKACCSFNYKDCSLNSYCSSSQMQCEAFCNGKWLTDWRDFQNCSGLNEGCNNSTNSKCCDDLTCEESLNGWQCQSGNINVPTNSPTSSNPKTLAPTNASVGSECCSFDYKICSNSNTYTNPCAASKTQCDSCRGFWINVDLYQNATCVAMYQRCSKTLRCCGGSCIDTSGYGDKSCQPIFTNPPTKRPKASPTKRPTKKPEASPTKRPTKKPVSFAPTILACCSWDYKTCFGNDLCDASRVNCESQCKGVWLDSWTKDPRKNCLPQNAICVQSPGDCCSPLSCVAQYGNLTSQCQSLTSSPSKSPTHSSTQETATESPSKISFIKYPTESPSNPIISSKPSIHPLTGNPTVLLNTSAFPSPKPSISYSSALPSTSPSASPTGELYLTSTSNQILLKYFETKMDSLQMTVFETAFETFLAKGFRIKGIQSVHYSVKINDQMLVNSTRNDDSLLSYNSRTLDYTGRTELYPLLLSMTVTMEYRVTDQSINSTKQLENFDKLIPMFIHDRGDVLINLLENDKQEWFANTTQINVVNQPTPAMQVNGDGEPAYAAKPLSLSNSTTEIQPSTISPALLISLAVAAFSAFALFAIVALKVNESYKMRSQKMTPVMEDIIHYPPFYSISPHPCTQYMADEIEFESGPILRQHLPLDSPEAILGIFDEHRAVEQLHSEENKIRNNGINGDYFGKLTTVLSDSESVVSNLTAPTTRKVRGNEGCDDFSTDGSELEQNISRLSFQGNYYDSALFKDGNNSKAGSEHLDFIKEVSSSSGEHSVASSIYQKTENDFMDINHRSLGKSQQDDEPSLDSYSNLRSKIMETMTAEVVKNDDALLEIGSFSDFNTSQEGRAVSNEIFSDDDKSVSNNSLDSYNRLWITSGAKASTLNSSQIEIDTVGRRRNDAACPTNRGGNETRNSYMNQQRQAMGDRSIAMDDLDKASVKNQNNDTVVSDVDFGDELGFGTDYC